MIIICPAAYGQCWILTFLLYFVLFYFKRASGRCNKPRTHSQASRSTATLVTSRSRMRFTHSSRRKRSILRNVLGQSARIGGVISRQVLSGIIVSVLMTATPPAVVHGQPVRPPMSLSFFTTHVVSFLTQVHRFNNTQRQRRAHVEPRAG